MALLLHKAGYGIRIVLVRRLGKTLGCRSAARSAAAGTVVCHDTKSKLGPDVVRLI
jgi:hypothetical protein